MINTHIVDKFAFLCVFIYLCQHVLYSFIDLTILEFLNNVRRENVFPPLFFFPYVCIPYWEKLCLRSYSRTLAQFFPIRTSRPANNIYIENSR